LNEKSLILTDTKLGIVYLIKNNFRTIRQKNKQSNRDAHFCPAPSLENMQRNRKTEQKTKHKRKTGVRTDAIVSSN
jgi:hypothetical protein